MAGKSRKVLCPRGHEMELNVERRTYGWTHPPLPDMWFAYYHCECGWTAPDVTGRNFEEVEQNAYEAAIEGTPNIRLNEKTLEELDDFDAVWVVDDIREVHGPFSAKYVREVTTWEDWWHRSLFARRPTKEDIARLYSAEGEEQDDVV